MSDLTVVVLCFLSFSVSDDSTGVSDDSTDELIASCVSGDSTKELDDQIESGDSANNSTELRTEIWQNDGREK